MLAQQDYYKVLGINRDASQNEIKRAFRSLARQAHPDKGGTEEEIKLLLEAHQTLSDPEKRAEFDRIQDGLLAMEGVGPEHVAGLLTSSAVRFSEQFKLQHQKWVATFKAKPKVIGDVRAFLTPYHAEIKKGTGVESIETVLDLSMTLTPEIAIKLFIDYLKGNLKAPKLALVRDYFAGEIAKTHPKAGQRILFEGIYAIISSSDSKKVLSGIKKITDYAKISMDMSLKACVLLFQNGDFRECYKLALHQYWQEPMILTSESMMIFNGRNALKNIIVNLQQRKAESTSGAKYNTYLNEQIHKAILLYRFEKDICVDADVGDLGGAGAGAGAAASAEVGARPASVSAAELRDQAFRIIDWTAAFFGVMNQAIIVNNFIRAGSYFQRAALVETQASVQMADERLAFEMYSTAVFIARRATPNIELYARAQGLKFLLSFRYQDEHLDKVIKDWQERVLMLANIFPFYEPLQANTSLFTEYGESILLLRRLLHGLMEIIIANRERAASIPIDHKVVNVIYHAYEASLKNWYEEHHNPEHEAKIQKMLMEELLAEKGWSHEDVMMNTDAIGVLVERDEEGWMVPRQKLPIPTDPGISIFQSIDGVEFNQNTGELFFSFRTKQEDYPEYTQLLTAYDISEMIEHGIDHAIFSLDGVDPDMQYHPFNFMRITPSAIYNTQLMHSMLITDYLLKFFTVGREVRSIPPYDRRALDPLLADLPEHLRKIIDDFHAAQRAESQHRFWIEAGKIEITEDDPASGVHRMAIGPLKMLVKKHIMKLDERGNLIDAEEADEGWNLYVFTAAQLQELRAGRRSLEQAMIFIKDTQQVYFYEEGVLSSVMVVEDCVEHIGQLFSCKRDDQEKIVRDEDNAWLLYILSKEVARQAKKPHCFSAEYCFATDFTAHYDEFAQYFPEFGRLRELSKACLLVNALKSIRESNRKNLVKIRSALRDTTAWGLREAEIQRAIRSNEDAYGRLDSENLAQMVIKVEEIFEKTRAKIIELQQSLRGQIRELRASARTPAEVNEVNEMVRKLKESIQKQVVEQLCEVFLGISESDIKIILATDNEDLKQKIALQLHEEKMTPARRKKERAIEKLRAIVYKEKTELEEKCKLLERLERQFTEIGLPEVVPEVDLRKICLWVPANVHHEVAADRSHFVYGGVCILPRTKQVPSGSAMASAMLGQVFNSRTQVKIDSAYLSAARAAGRAESGTRGAANVTYNIRLGELLKTRTAAASARAATPASARAATSTGGAGAGAGAATRGVATTVPIVTRAPPAAAAGGAGASAGAGAGSTGTSSGGRGSSGGSAGGSGSGGGGGRMPPVSPPASAGAGAGRAGAGSAADAYSGPAGRPPSPTLVFGRDGRGVKATAREFRTCATHVESYDYKKLSSHVPLEKARTFMAHKFDSYRLEEDFVIYRAGAERELGEFFSFERPASELQARMDKAIRPIWPGGGSSVVENGYAIKIPKGSLVYVGLAAPQGDAFLGGTQQIYIPEAKKLAGIEVLGNYELRGGMIWNLEARRG
jgi:curved DNA-binding protein CbpA